MKRSTIILILALLIAIGVGLYLNGRIPAKQPASSSVNYGNLSEQALQEVGSGAGTTKKFDLAIGSSADVGDYLASYNPTTQQKNMALYTFAKDKPGISTCYGECATNWPPLYVAEFSATGSAGELNIKDFATIEREDGKQLTYKGRPLYFYSGDVKSGDTKGDGMGGVWFVAKP